jgi:hypothetical protein
MSKLKYKKWLVAIIVAVMTLTPLFAGSVYALEIREADAGESLVVTEDISGNYLAAGDRVEINANIDGDLYVTGGEVMVKGDVNGNVYASGGLITIDGYVAKSLFASGGDVSVRGDVSRNLYVAGGQVVVDGNVGEDLIGFGGDVRVNGIVGEDIIGASGLYYVMGYVGGDALLSAGSLLIDSDVGGDATVASEDLRINSESIGGDLLVYNSNADYAPKESTVLGGEFTLRTTEYESVEFDISSSLTALGIMVAVVNTIGLFILGVFVVRLMPVKLESSVARLGSVRDWVIYWLYGVVTVIIVSMFAVALLISVIGWPLLGFLVALGLIAYYLSFIIVSIKIGRAILSRKRSNYTSMLLGLVIIQFLRFVPFIGWFVSDVIIFVGIGVMVKSKIDMMNGGSVEMMEKPVAKTASSKSRKSSAKKSSKSKKNTSKKK